MGIVIRTAREDDWEPMLYADARAFGYTPTDERAILSRQTLDMGRFHLAFDGNEIVGVTGSHALDVTLPGGAIVPMGGVTWVSVAATHRRRGILGRLMSACHDGIAARGEPVAMLTASEGGIYERFGYGAATRVRVTEIDRRLCSLRADVVPTTRSVRFVQGDEALAHLTAIWERHHRRRAGEVARDDAFQRFLLAIRALPGDGGSGITHTLAHPDGYATYRITDDWNAGMPQHKLDLTEIVALTPDAHAQLWHAILGVDLVATIRTRQLAIDEPLPYLLDNPRALRTVGLNDGIWVNVLDVPTFFSARTYRTVDALVIEADGQRYRIEGSPDGGVCKRVRTRPDVVLSGAALGALSLGGVSVTELVAGRRATARNADVLRRADLFFTTAEAPHCQTFY